MADMADITAYDGASTPVNHTFKPISVSTEKGVTTALWREQDVSIPFDAQGKVTMKSFQLPSGIWRRSVRVEIPVMESVTSANAAGYTAAPKVAYVNTIEASSFSSERATIADTRIVRMLLVNIMNNITASVAAATAGPAPLLIDTAVAPT
jgi:hypothetical protein